MARLLSRAALRALTGRRESVVSDVFPARPDGPLIWAHATSGARLEALCDIGARLKSPHPDLQVLLTVDPGMSMDVRAEDDAGCDWLLPVPPGGAGPARQFLDHWRPDIGLWTGGHLNPTLILSASAAGIPLVLLDADAAGFEARRRGWFPDPMRVALNRFSRVLASNAAAAAAMQRAGLAPARIEVTGRLQLAPNPPPCADSEVAEVAQELAGRPTWLAALVHPDEAGAVLSAHRKASRFAHRLLLAVVPDGDEAKAGLRALLDGMLLRHVVWHPGDPIGDDLQVLLIDDPEALGLWYRISPQAFIGHSLIPGGQGQSPMAAAALGSAVLYGPNVAAHKAAYARLGVAGAANMVADADALSAEVARLIAPDKAAEMALAGWDVATEGAEMADRLMALILGFLDADHGGDDAGA